MSTMLIALNATREIGQFLGDQLCSIKAAWLFAQNHPCDRYLMAVSPSNEQHFMWQKFIDTFNVELIEDSFIPGNMDQRFAAWSKWHKEREINGIKFDIYKELYRRIDGSHRQRLLCGGEKGLQRKNIFEYFYYGQEEVRLPVVGSDEFDDTLIYHPPLKAERDAFIAPYAKCQGNHVFTFSYWEKVVGILLDSGITVTINHNGHFAEHFAGHPLYRKAYPSFNELVDEVCRHKIVACGNTGVGWVAGACGVPLMAMQPINSNMPDYRYELCGVKSLVELIDQPDAEYCARRLIEEVNRTVVLTTGCYDVLHAGHIRHLEESRLMGTRLVVALNSDLSVKRLKGNDRPLNPQNQRKKVLESIRFVDEVRIFDGDTAIDIIEQVRPMVITNGCDHKVTEIVGKDFVEQYGGRVAVTGGTRETSSTQTIAKILKISEVLKIVTDAASCSVNPVSKLKLLADQFRSVSSLSGDVAELGTYRGGCGMILRRLAQDKELHLFDTWQGNPFDDPLCHHRKGEWIATLAEARSLIGDGPFTHYHIGTFPETAEDLKDKQFCFVYVDPDTYQSVSDAIEFFWPRMVYGGKMMFDDYGWHACAGVEKAVNEHFTESQRVVYQEQFTCVVVKK